MTDPPRGPAAEFGRFLEIQNLGLNLPFALAFLLTASSGRSSPWTILWIVVAFVSARNAGHAFNRIVDREYDRQNPRTRGRALVTGRYSTRFAVLVVIVSSAALLVAAYLLNPLAFALAPVALLAVFGYSYTKRFTALTTVFLGVVEGIVPAATYIAVRGDLPSVALAAVAALVCWGTAFETVHSLGDVESDRAAHLASIPVRIGVPRSVALIPALHAVALGFLVLFGVLASLSLWFFAGVAVMAVVTATLDLWVARDPGQTARPFRLHMALGAIFLVAVALALYLPTTFL
ncbi:MAG: putative 4-hydroxybenzoate polyprenyltransferase [Thermoplasmata archaeon]|nr:putative 4-hydroxybenzoate polyprenyltransferase [Thermoplasmata archaeon]